MTKPELVREMAKNGDLLIKDSEVALNALIEVISAALARGEKVPLTGFGVFEVATRAERKARNPKTNAEILVPETKYPKFRFSKTVKQMLK